MPLTKDFRETIRDRAQQDPRFRKALLREAIELMLSGDEKTGRAILRNYINATVGFRQLAEATSLPANTPGSGVASRADIAHMMLRSVAQDDRDPAMRGADPGCPAFQAGWNAQPGPGLVAGVAVPLASEESRSKYPPGAPLGDCALRLGTAGAPGFAIYGTPIPERRAELRVAALDRQSLVIQLYDPRPGAPGGHRGQGGWESVVQRTRRD